MKKRKMFFRMITASLFRRKSRMIVALLAIAVGGMILSGLITIYNDVPRQMSAQFRNYGANMILTATDASFDREEFEAAVACIDADELVGATPYRYNTVRMHEQPIQAAGTEMDNLQKTSPYWSVEGEYPDEEGELLIGENVAEDLQLSVGDVVTVSYTPEDTSELDATIDFTVVGIVSTGGSEEDYVYMSLEDMAYLTEESDVFDLAEISISSSSSGLSAYMNTINDSSDGLVASLVKRVTASETTVLSKLQYLILLVTIVVLALTMICVATTMTAVVSERRKEIGLRKAIGASDASIMSEFMFESMLLGAFGGLIGSFLGFGFAQYVSVNVFSSYITLRPALVPVTIVASVAITGLASLQAIRNTTKVDPALVLKGE